MGAKPQSLSLSLSPSPPFPTPLAKRKNFVQKEGEIMFAKMSNPSSKLQKYNS